VEVAMKEILNKFNTEIKKMVDFKNSDEKE
jgi:hypothetical protein